MFEKLPFCRKINNLSENVLFTANYTKLYRHSFYADYYIFNVADKTTVPLVDDQVGGNTLCSVMLKSADFQIYNMLDGHQ